MPMGSYATAESVSRITASPVLWRCPYSEKAHQMIRHGIAFSRHARARGERLQLRPMSRLSATGSLCFQPFGLLWYLIQRLDGDPTIHDGSGDYRSDDPEEQRRF